jgi:Cu/Zn superoxide dismutase
MIFIPVQNKNNFRLRMSSTYAICFFFVCLTFSALAEKVIGHAYCEMQHNGLNIGTIQIREQEIEGFSGLFFEGELKLPEHNDGEYGFHIHEKNDLGNECKNTGSHYNPWNVVHGGPRNQIR